MPKGLGLFDSIDMRDSAHLMGARLKATVDALPEYKTWEHGWILAPRSSTRAGAMHDPASELLRTPSTRSSENPMYANFAEPHLLVAC